MLSLFYFLFNLSFLNAGCVQSQHVDVREHESCDASLYNANGESENEIEANSRLSAVEEKSASQVDHSFHFMKLPVELQRYIVCLAALDWQSADIRLLKGNYVTLDELRQNGFKLDKGALALRLASQHFNQLMMDHGKGPGCLAVFTPRKQSDIEACLLGPYPRVVRLKKEGLRCVMQDSFLQKFPE